MNNLNRGTPRTLGEAINNALTDMKVECKDQRILAGVIEVHCIDFLAQKFSVAFAQEDLFDAEAIKELWNKVKKAA